MIAHRRLRDAHRLNLERTRDALFEAKAILAELERDNSLADSVRRSLAEEIDRLELENALDGLQQALVLRNRIRSYYL